MWESEQELMSQLVKDAEALGYAITRLNKKRALQGLPLALIDINLNVVAAGRLRKLERIIHDLKDSRTLH